MERIKKYWKQVLFFLSIMGPGLITASADNDSGGIATYAVAGAQYGYALLWTLIPVTLLLIYTLDISTKLGVVTHQGLAALIREKFRVKLTVPLLLLVFVANFGTTVSEFAGISSSFNIIGSQVGLYQKTVSNISWLSGLSWGSLLQSIAVILCALLIWVFVVKGDYKRVEKVFLTLILFYVAYIISAVLAKPDWHAALTALVVPTFKNDPNFIFTTIGLIGTTITPWMYFYHNSTVAEKGISEEDIKYSRMDSMFGALITDIVAFFIIVASAATIFVNKLSVTTVEDIGRSLVPLAGAYAGYLFSFGLLNASIFAAAILPLSTSYIICEALGWETGIDRGFRDAPQFYTIFTTMIVVSSLIILIPGMPLLMIMRVSQVANGVLLPFFLVYLLLLAEDKKLMGKYAAQGVLRVIGWLVAALLIVLDILLVFGPIFTHS